MNKMKLGCYRLNSHKPVLMADSIQEWVHSIPPVTKFWFLTTGLCSLFVKFGIIQYEYLYLSAKAIFTKFQIWRIPSSLLIIPFSSGSAFKFLTDMYFIYNYSIRLETGAFASSKSDYLYMLLFNCTIIAIFGLILDVYFCADALIFSTIYVWAQLNADEIVNFWFGITLKAKNFPWVLLGVNAILFGSFKLSLMGLLAGHLYYFLKYIYPRDLNGPQLLGTPQFLKQLFKEEKVERSFKAQAGYAVFAPREPESAQHNQSRWGRGRRLDE
uniref:Derlin n=1 Tax=Myxobolus squamalis TaxID=59785 RepID=A0A6B2G6A1_MYXSQ